MTPTMIEAIAKAINGPLNLEHQLIPGKLIELRELTWRQLSVQEQGRLRLQAQAALSAFLAQAEVEGFQMVPKEPTEGMWSGLARQIVMWARWGSGSTGKALHQHLKMLRLEIPDWLRDEIKDENHVPPKGTVAVCIYKAMLSAPPRHPRGMR